MSLRPAALPSHRSTGRSSSPRPDAFWRRRDATVERLARAGMPRALAEAWIAAWDLSTAELADFRLAPDFWTQGYRFALEEYRRGYRPDRSFDERERAG
jgi:hypothetical protein